MRKLKWTRKAGQVAKWESLLLISKVIDPVIYTVMVIPRKLLSFWPAFSRQ